MTFPERSVDRVTAHTAADINLRIREQTEARVSRLARLGVPAIEQRLHELDSEWDIERCIETGAASLVLTGLALGKTVHRAWYALPAAVGAFLLQHALQGWCPPLPVFRRLGVRTAEEIQHERTALKVLRGDFAGVDPRAPQAFERAISAALH